MSEKNSSDIPIRIHYACPRGGRVEHEKLLVETSIRHLLGNTGFIPEGNGANKAVAWVIVDGSLPDARARIDTLREYVEAVVELSPDQSFGQIPFPVIVSANVYRWQRHGFRFPAEFLLPLNQIVTLGDRLHTLHLLYGKDAASPLELAGLRDFVVGNFREELGLDHSHHGTTSNLQNAIIDLKQLAQRIDAEPEYKLSSDDRQVLFRWGLPPTKNERTDVTNPLTKVFERAAGADSIYRKLFPKRSEELQGSSGMPGMLLQVKLLANLASRGNAAPLILMRDLPALSRSFPRWRGHGLASLPVTRLTGLVVDDQAKELLHRLNRTPIESERRYLPMEKLIHFHSAFPTDGEVTNYLQALQKFLGQAPADGVCPRCIDFVLLDLSFTGEGGSDESSDNGSRGDPLGWRLLPVLRRHFPDIPIIIHSWFASSTQVRLAYERGADWFLAKDDDHKLPSHLYQLLEHPQWEREWKSHEREIEFDLPSERIEQNHEKFLWWKCMKSLPGDCIRIRPLGGGISGAVTAKAWKRINGRYDRLPPIIIKIDHPFAMGMEYKRYKRFVAPYLSNRAGRIHEQPTRADREHSAIAYTCAGGSQGISGHGNRTEVITLLKLLEMNSPRDSSEIIPAERYEPLLRHLLEDTLARIHNIEPEHDEDFPNLVFGEFKNPLNGYLARFPSSQHIQLTKPLLCASEEKGERVLLTSLDSRVGTLDALRMPDGSGGLIERLTLAGPLSGHYARYRELRRNQIVRLEDADQTAEVDVWPKVHEDHREMLSAFLEYPSNINAQLTRVVNYLRGKGARHFEGLRRGIVHGDLNLNNLMVERRLGDPPVPVVDETWLIDFAWTRRDAIAIDFAQLEMDLLIRLGKRHLFCDKDRELDSRLITEFSRGFLETPWQAPHSVTTDPRREFLFRLMKQVRDAADAAHIDATAYAHVRLAALLITAKLRLKKMALALGSGCSEDDAFAGAMCLSWIFHQFRLLSPADGANPIRKAVSAVLPKRIILVRHAESEANANAQVYREKPDHLHELTDKGRQEAAEVGRKMADLIAGGTCGIFVSPHKRTLQTMKISCSEIGCDFSKAHQDPRLREQDYGPLHSAEEAETYRNEREIHGWLYYRFPGGESCADVFDRVSTFLETLHRRFREEDCPENVLIFTHGTAMKCFLMRWYHLSREVFESMPHHPPNGHVVVLERQQGENAFKAREPFGAHLKVEELIP